MEGSLVGLPCALAVVDHAHVDVLGIEGSHQYLVSGRGLQLVVPPLWSGLQGRGEQCEVRGERLRQLALGHGTVVEHGVLIVRQMVQQVEQLLRVGLCELFVGEGVAVGVVWSVEPVLQQILEVHLLVVLAVGPLLGRRGAIHHPCRGVDACIVHQMVDECEGLRHILTEAVEADGDVACSDVDMVGAGQLVELLIELLGRE